MWTSFIIFLNYISNKQLKTMKVVENLHLKMSHGHDIGLPDFSDWDKGHFKNFPNNIVNRSIKIDFFVSYINLLWRYLSKQVGVYGKL